MSKQSLTTAYPKITELSWEPTFVVPAPRFGTDYMFEETSEKDPAKQIIRHSSELGIRLECHGWCADRAAEDRPRTTDRADS